MSINSETMISSWPWGGVITTEKWMTIYDCVMDTEKWMVLYDHSANVFRCACYEDGRYPLAQLDTRREFITPSAPCGTW